MKKPLALFCALADPTRLRIVSLLRRMELAVGELAQVLGQSQPRVSRHVRILCDAGIARRRKEGSWVFLEPGDPETVEPVFHAIDQWNAGEADDPRILADAALLDAVRADRAAAAERYFASHAEHWDSLRSLHVAESEVELAMSAALGQQRLGRLVDIGTGTGRMIELFGPKSDHALGLDRSPEMLRLARGKLATTDEFEWELRKGDLATLPLADASADTIILHQVLHYLPDPGAAIREIARIAASGGQVLIVDFAPHDREELRISDAHARLGFSDEQMSGWFEASGLESGTVTELGGGALTVKLWLGHKPTVKQLKAVNA